jgi:1-acyl-sn-glycerol-3-phosphate acyltransferase
MVRAAWRLTRATLHVLHGLLIALLVLPRASEAQRQARVQWWAVRLLALLGVELQVQGHFRPGAKLIVANHISWLDIMAIHAVHPQARFVSKADVQHWPLLGRLVAAGGTLYIQRERRRDALRVVHQMAEAMAAGDTVAVFPEGTTADGRALLPFHANLLQAAIATDVPVQPVALRYSDALNAISPAAEFVGETTLVQSLWRLAGARGLRVRVQVLLPQSCTHADRRALAERLRQDIDAALA